MRHRFNVFADYFQFVLFDESSTDDFSKIWTEEALGRMLAVGDRAACLGTLRNVRVNVEIDTLDQAPEVDLEQWDHAAEGSLAVLSGNLVVMGCTGYLPDAPRIKVRSGVYQLLFVVGGIQTIQDEGETAMDLYRVYLWPGAARPAKCLKHWKHEA